MNLPAALSVVIPTYRRTARTHATLNAILACDPRPAEIVVHVDFGDEETGPEISERHPNVTILEAFAPQGPGGARNLLVAAATYPVVVSLDDDSYPIDIDFFADVLAAFDAHPEAAVLAMTIIHDGEAMVPREVNAVEVADFVGCGCAYRRDAFLTTSGYVPLRPAYGMEEADLALQIIDCGASIIHVGTLRVRHVTSRTHQDDRRIVSAHIKNTLLLAFLRYPLARWPLGFAQFANRIRYSLGRGSVLGVMQGILGTPAHVVRYMTHRKVVKPKTITAVRRLRRQASVVPSAANRV